MKRDPGQTTESQCFAKCEREQFQQRIDELQTDNNDLGAALVQAVINDAQRVRQLKESEGRLKEAIRLLHKDADWFDVNGEASRARELRERITPIQEKKDV